MLPRIFIASSAENLQVVHAICDRLDDPGKDHIRVEAVPRDGGTFERGRLVPSD